MIVMWTTHGNNSPRPGAASWLKVRCSIISFLGFGLSVLSPLLGVGVRPVQAQIVGPIVKQGYGIQFNQRTYFSHWVQWTSRSGQPHFGITDSGLNQQFGFELLSTDNPEQQPVQWFAQKSLPAQVHPLGRYRFVDITSLAGSLGWRIQPQGQELRISAPAGRVGDVRLGSQAWGKRIVVDLDRPVPWRLSKLTYSRNGTTPQRFSFTIDAQIESGTARRWEAAALGAGLNALAVTAQNGQTVIQGTMNGKMRLHLWTLANPARLIIDVRPNAPRARTIVWAPGVVWQDQLVSLGERQFPVTWIAVDPQRPSTQLKPIWGNANSLVGTTPLATMVQRAKATAAINAGFFSRSTRTPLGALRREGLWASSPILTRGAVGWTPQGRFLMDRLILREWLTTSGGKTLAIKSRDSGFAQGGVAVYTRFWGTSYRPLTAGEQILTVQRDQVTRRSSGTTVPIPQDGYLLVLRSQTPAAAFPIGTQIRLQAQANPKQFNPFPNIVGGGPLLIKNGQEVLNAGAERFRAPFGTQVAPRSGIAQLTDGTILLATAHRRVNGPSPTLGQWAAILRKLGAVHALNLDGGSSSSLYLGGQYIDRHAGTAARVHNGIGLFINADR